MAHLRQQSITMSLTGSHRMNDAAIKAGFLPHNNHLLTDFTDQNDLSSKIVID